MSTYTTKLHLNMWTVAWGTINHRKSSHSRHWIKENRETHGNQRKTTMYAHIHESQFFNSIKQLERNNKALKSFAMIVKTYKGIFLKLKSPFFHLLLPVWCFKGALQIFTGFFCLSACVFSVFQHINESNTLNEILNSQKVKMLRIPLPYNYKYIRANKSVPHILLVLSHRGQGTKLHHTHFHSFICFQHKLSSGALLPCAGWDGLEGLTVCM